MIWNKTRKQKQPTKHKLNTLMIILSFYVRTCVFLRNHNIFQLLAHLLWNLWTFLGTSWKKKKSNWSLELKRCKGAWIITLFLNFCFAKDFIFGTRSKHYGKQTFKVLFIWLICIRSSTIYTLRTTCEIHLINIGYA